MEYRLRETIQAEQYDGSAESVERIMTMLGRTSGIMNTSEGYMLLDQLMIRKSNYVILDPSDKNGWRRDYEENFNSRYEKLD